MTVGIVLLGVILWFSTGILIFRIANRFWYSKDSSWRREDIETHAALAFWAGPVYLIAFTIIAILIGFAFLFDGEFIHKLMGIKE